MKNMIVCAEILAVTLIFLLKCLSIHASALYHIKNSSSAPCPNEPCLTLPQFAVNPEVYLESNTTLIFLLGNHHLNVHINISEVSNLSMHSSSASSCCPTVICEQNAGINFSTIDNIFIGYMRFVGCHNHQAIAVKMFMLESAAFLFHSGSALQFISTEAKIVRSSFTSNSGGSIHNVPFALEFTAEDLILIALFGDSYKYPLTGAAIAVTQSNIGISDCVFEGNRAQIGGAIFVEQLSNVTITDTSFERNFATCHLSRCTSGAIYLGNSSMTVFNSTFFGNKLVDNHELVLLYGGVFGLFESTLIAEQCNFINSGIENASFSYDKDSVGVIYGNNTMLTIRNSAFISNSNASTGVLSVSNATCIITKTTFENNSANDHVGVMHSENSTIEIHESEFKFNFIHGVFTVSDTNISITNNTFENNTAYYDGGVMTVYNNNNIDITECNFTRNYAGRDGGVISMRGTNVSITITDSLCSENFAKEGGGVIDIQIQSGDRNADIITLKNTRFIKNEGEQGEAVVSSKGGVMMLISECEFIGNTAFYGGTLSVANTNVTINGGIMERNRVFVGLIYAVQEASVSINATVIKNTITRKKGFPIVYILQSTGYLSHLTLADNQGSIVAVFSNMTFYEMAIYRSPKLDFSTYEDGGAIIIVQSKIVFEGTCSLNENYAAKGGAVHAIESKIHVYGKTTIANNTAWMYGGCLLYTSPSPRDATLSRMPSSA